MAALMYSLSDKPRIGFSLGISGYENGRGLGYDSPNGRVNFDFNFDWFECRLIIESFDKKIEHPRIGSMYFDELPSFTPWLRELSSKEKSSYETFFEPFFRMDVERWSKDSEKFDVNLLLSAYGITPGFLHIESGISVRFPVIATQFVDFANQLEKEEENLHAKYSKQLEQWVQYKNAEHAKIERELALKKKAKSPHS